MPRNHDILIKASKEEKAKIKKKAEACGLSLSAFIRFIALRTQVREVKKQL